MTDDRYTTWDAPYILGALSADERAEYEEHLVACEACRSAVNELAGVPGVLGRLDRESVLAMDAEEDAPAGAPVVDLVPRLSRRTVRRRRLARGLAAAAVAAGIVGGVTAGLVIPGVGAGGRTVELASAAGTPVTGSLTAERASWGTRLEWDCSYGDPAAARAYLDDRYELTVTTTDGRTRDVASWSAAGRSSTGLAASVALPLDSIRSVAIRDESGARLAGASL